MNNTMHRRNALQLCRAARPEVADVLLSPYRPAAQALLEEILTMPIETQPTETAAGAVRCSRPRPRRSRSGVTVIASACVAAAVLAAAVLVNITGSGTSRGPRAGTAAPQFHLVNIERVAAASTASLEGSGRAHVVFDLQAGSPFSQHGTNEVAWSGRNVEMKVHIDATDDRPASDAWTKTVEGEFYTYTGPKGQPRHWVHDANPSTANGHELFDADPRTLMSILDPAARFTETGTDVIDGVATRRLHATAVDEVPVVNLGLAPDATNTKVTRLDLWVGPDDVVRRLDLALRRTDTKAESQPSTGVSYDSSYSVTFTDLGTPISVTAPADAQDVSK